MRSSVVLFNFVLIAASAQGPPQTTFSSGSTGVDGPLTYAPNLGPVYFPPAGLAQRPNNIYNFTTITIGAGTTVRLSNWVLNGPVYWLAEGNVLVQGTVDLSGKIGHPPNAPISRAPNEAGAGGYSGGLAANGAISGQNATSGSGPGGGQAAGFDATNLDVGGGGIFTGNNYLQPLVGGSGGGGGCRPVTVNSCAGGGAGGGAVLIASSTQITIGASYACGQFNCCGGGITAAGGSGNNNYGGGGSGGAIRLVSNTITHLCGLNAGGGKGVGSAGEISSHDGGSGIIRLEGFTVSGAPASAIVSTPVTITLPIGGPSTVSVTKVNVAINANPFSFPDVTINTGSPVPVVISGVNIPPGTTGNLYVYGETTPDQTIPFTLTGTLQSTTATVNVSYPSVGSRGFAKVTWTGQ